MRNHFDLGLHIGDLDHKKLTCLDLGCGPYGSVVAAQMCDYPWKELTSVDGHKESIEEAKEKKFKAKKHKFIVGDVRKFTGKFDVIVSFDVLEHMTKEDGHKWIKRLEERANKKLVLLFPVEPADFHRKNTWDNPLQDHLSHWKIHELKQLGFETTEYFGTHMEEKPDGSTVSFGCLWATKSF